MIPLVLLAPSSKNICIHIATESASLYVGVNMGLAGCSKVGCINHTEKPDRRTQTTIIQHIHTIRKNKITPINALQLLTKVGGIALSFKVGGHVPLMPPVPRGSAAIVSIAVCCTVFDLVGVE